MHSLTMHEIVRRGAGGRSSRIEYVCMRACYLSHFYSRFLFRERAVASMSTASLSRCRPPPLPPSPGASDTLRPRDHGVPPAATHRAPASNAAIAFGVLLLNVLQCTDVDRDRLLESLRKRLAPRCGVLASVPNCHFGEEDILRRPRRRDHPRHDRSLVHKDLRFLTRWFYRSGFQQVESFGTYDAFVLGRR